MLETLNDILNDPASAGALPRGILAVMVFVLAAISYAVATGLVKLWVRSLSAKKRRPWIDALFDVSLLRALARMVPVFVLYRFTPIVFVGIDTAAYLAQRLLTALLTILALIVLTRFFRVAERIYNRFSMARDRPIKGILQLLLIFVYSIGGVWIIALLLDKPAWGFLSGIGALSAVLLLVFKDTLLGVAASFQIGANNMVSIGDWIEMPKYNADGDVIDISLQTIKVRNWDKTITTIPIYALVSDSFKNWRGMFETGGRRIMRSINIDMRSIRFCDDVMIARFRKMHYLQDYVEQKTRELEQYNREHDIDATVPVNGRRMTNIGTFRAYMTEYLKRHPSLRQDMMLMVRQLDPSSTGLPLQVWAFTATTVWVNYEAIQADIFDHLLAVLPAFDLRAFQTPSGWDLECGLADRGRSLTGSYSDPAEANAVTA